MPSPEAPIVITLASKNPGKQMELQCWLESADFPVRLVLNENAPDVDETGADFIDNAWLKAMQTPPAIPGGYVLGEDSGMVVDALDGKYGISPFPGLYSNRWLTQEIRDELLGRSFPNRMPLDRMTENGVTNSDLCQGVLALLRDEPNRRGRYCCGMVLWHPERGKVFEVLETTELQVIDDEPRGMHGFGYDPVTAPVDKNGQVSQRTMAELSPEEKNAISHRGRAFKRLLDFLSLSHSVSHKA